MTSGLPVQHLRIATEDDETIVDLTPLQGLWTVENISPSPIRVAACSNMLMARSRSCQCPPTVVK